MNWAKMMCYIGLHRWTVWTKRVMPSGIKLLMWRDRHCLSCGAYQSEVEQ